MNAEDWAGYSRFRDDFAEVLDPKLYSIIWLDNEVRQGRFRIIVGEEAAIVFGLRFYPTGAKDVEGLIAAGDLNEIVEVLIPQAEEYGRSIGCVGAIIESREGWAKVLKSRGYEPHQVALRKVF